MNLRLCSNMLREYGEITRAAMMRFLPDREPRRYLYEPLSDYPKRGGRYMRPTMHIASAKAHGATLEQAAATAVSIELLHNALLVIDDIQDESEERRGSPTLHRKHGIPIALNVGSTMSVLSLAPLLRNVATGGPHVALWIFENAITVAQNSAEGQAMELGWRFDNRIDVTESEYLGMVLRKTCAYSTIFPLTAGAILGLQQRVVPDPVLRFGFLVGAAFQIQDDLLNLVGASEQYGKELFGDLLEGKRTLLIIRLLQCCSGDEREVIHGFLGKDRREKTNLEVNDIMELLRKYDCIGYVRQMLHGIVGAAQHEFDRGFGRLPESRDKEFLRQLPIWIIEQT